MIVLTVYSPGLPLIRLDSRLLLASFPAFRQAL